MNEKTICFISAIWFLIAKIVIKQKIKQKKRQTFVVYRLFFA